MKHLHLFDTFRLLRCTTLATALCATASAAFAGLRGPVLIEPSIPDLAGELSSQEGSLTIRGEVNKRGIVSESQVLRSSNSELDEFFTEAFEKWKYEPAQVDRKPIQSIVFQQFSLRDGVITHKAMTPDRPPAAKKRVAPKPPKALGHLAGRVKVQATISQEGIPQDIVVLESEQPELDPFVIEAFMQWTFRPAMKNGEPVAQPITAPIIVAATGPAPKPIKEPTIALKRAKPISRIKPDLPEKLLNRTGHCKLLLSIDPEGQVTQVEVIDASDRDLTRLAAKTALSWKFRPAKKEGVPIPSQVLQAFHFNGGKDGMDTEEFQLPQVEDLPLPELPAALTGQKGYVDLELQLDENGHVLQTKVLESSSPDFEQVAIEAAQAWKFTPAFNQGNPVPTTIALPIKFGES